MRMTRVEFGWLGLIGIVLLLGIWWIPGGGTVSTDTYSVAHSGKKAFFRVLRHLGAGARRGTNQLVPHLDFGDGTLLILGPARYPTSKEWSEICQHVSAGANLVFAARSDDPLVRIDNLGMRVVMPESERKLGGRRPQKTDKTEESDKIEDASNLFKTEQATAKTELIDGIVHWSGPSFLKASGTTWTTLVEADGRPRVMARQYGSGHVVVVSSDRIFSNQTLLDAKSAMLAYRIVASNGLQSPVIVDETLNRSGVPKVFGILFDSELRPLTLQLILVLVLFGWSGSRRFGPALPPVEPARRSIVEHAIALGGLYYRTRSAGMALARWMQYFRHELHLTSHDQAVRKEAEMLARWAGLDAADVCELLDSLIRAMRDPKTSNALAAKQIRTFAELKLRIMNRLRRPTNAA